ncbi:MAG: hypothetical protein FJ265_07205 [Planctomycetes bacterium]|nr:hypothetical protein [Planctomycetota bacterium]
MRKSLRRTVPTLGLLLALAACQTNANTAPQRTAPAPLGETATVSFEQRAMTYVETDWLLDQPILAGTTPTNFRVRLVYGVDVAHALLAEQCVRANWDAARTLAAKVFDNLKPDAEQFRCERCRKNWEQDLRAQFTEVLFPCHGGAPLATVTSIVWRTGTN